MYNLRNLHYYEGMYRGRTNWQHIQKIPTNNYKKGGWQHINITKLSNYIKVREKKGGKGQANDDNH